MISNPLAPSTQVNYLGANGKRERLPWKETDWLREEVQRTSSGIDRIRFREKPAARQIHRVPLSWSLIRLGPKLSRSSASPTMLPWSAPKKAKAQAAPFSAPFPRYPLLAAREEDSCLRVAAIS
ncbi:hypothetical protein MRB53_018342 [Persea americana]|uniref:Uncharacterized protein n=1 Tax=Persea americana TaxID=3435 RepID=A0ACC2M7Q9_PERAE|nr:hypothetical protein MRB53_018342 [Persea americana]